MFNTKPPGRTSCSHEWSETKSAKTWLSYLSALWTSFGSVDPSAPTILRSRGLFHKTFFFVFYGHFAVNYRIFAIYEQIYCSKFGRNYKIVIYGSVKFYGIGPWIKIRFFPAVVLVTLLTLNFVNMGFNAGAVKINWKIFFRVLRRSLKITFTRGRCRLSARKICPKFPTVFRNLYDLRDKVQSFLKKSPIWGLGFVTWRWHQN